MLQSPQTKLGRCVSRSFTGAHCGAFGCKGSQATHHLGQKALQGPGIPILHQNNSSHFGTAATGIFTTNKTKMASICSFSSSGAITRAVTYLEAKSILQFMTHQRTQGLTHVHFSIAFEGASNKSTTKAIRLFRSRPARLSAAARNGDPLARQQMTSQTRSPAPAPKHKMSGPGDPFRRIATAQLPGRPLPGRVLCCAPSSDA